MSQGSKKPPAKSGEGQNLLERVVCSKSPGESSVEPRIRNGLSRILDDIAVLVQSHLAFLTFTDLHLRG